MRDVLLGDPLDLQNIVPVTLGALITIPIAWVIARYLRFEPPYLHDQHQIILELEVEQISEPFHLGDSYYIVQVIERTQPDVRSFDEVQPFIRDELTQQRHDALVQQLEERLTATAELVVYDQVIDAYAARLAPPGAQTTGP